MCEIVKTFQPHSSCLVSGLGVSHIDKMAPVTKEDFDNFEKELADKVTNFSSSEYYPEFIEKLVRRLCVDRKFCLLFHMMAF